MTGDRLDAFYYRTPEDEEKDVRSYGFEPHPLLQDSMRTWIRKTNLISNPNKFNYSGPRIYDPAHDCRGGLWRII